MESEGVCRGCLSDNNSLHSMLEHFTKADVIGCVIPSEPLHKLYTRCTGLPVRFCSNSIIVHTQFISCQLFFDQHFSLISNACSNESSISLI